jgi:hypothetical protein
MSSRTTGLPARPRTSAPPAHSAPGRRALRHRWEFAASHTRGTATINRLTARRSPAQRCCSVEERKIRSPPDRVGEQNDRADQRISIVRPASAAPPPKEGRRPASHATNRRRYFGSSTIPRIPGRCYVALPRKWLGRNAGRLPISTPATALPQNRHPGGAGHSPVQLLPSRPTTSRPAQARRRHTTTRQTRATKWIVQQARPQQVSRPIQRRLDLFGPYQRHNHHRWQQHQTARRVVASPAKK